MTDHEARKVQLRNAIELKHFSLSNTTHPLHRITLIQEIEKLQALLDNMEK